MFNILDQISVVGETTQCLGIDVPNSLFNLVAMIINGIKIVVPILLIIWGMLDFAKAIIAKKEEDIKNYQKLFVSRIISAVLVFVIIFVVQLVFSMIGKVEKESGADNQSRSLWECSKMFINGVDTENSDSSDSEE